MSVEAPPPPRGRADLLAAERGQPVVTAGVGLQAADDDAAHVRLALPVPHDAVGVSEAIQPAQVVHGAVPYAKSARPAREGPAKFENVPPASHLLAFTIAAFLIILVPGPSVLFVVSRAIALGRATGVATVAGNTIGAFCQVVAVAIGIGPLVERSVLVLPTRR
jgi:hypothetical protein